MFDPIISESQLLGSTNPLQPTSTGFNANPLVQQSSSVAELQTCRIADINSGSSANLFSVDAQPTIVGSGKNRLMQTGTDRSAMHSVSRTQGNQSDALAPVGASTDRAAWIKNNIDDRSLQTAVLNRTQDGLLNRADMLHIFKQAEDDDRVSRQEFQDLKQIVNGQLKTLMPEFVQSLSSKVVNGDFANRNYQGEKLGDLAAGSSDEHLDQLVGKWFLGTDRPDAQDGNGEDYSYRRVNQVLFRNGVSAQDVVQGRIANCYLLASLGAVAKDSPQTIQNMFIDNGDNTYTVRFFKDGRADYVTVDNALPTKNGKHVFADYKRELWVALAEKAYAQLNESGWISDDNAENSYRGTSGGRTEESTQQITGLRTQSRSIDRWSTPDSLIQSLQANQMVTLSSQDRWGRSAKIVGDHAYTLLNYNSTTGLFTVYNPWGFDNNRSRVKDSNPEDGKINLTWTEVRLFFERWQALK